MRKSQTLSLDIPNLSNEQKSILNSNASKVLVAAGPGTGKSTVLAACVERHVNRFKRCNGKVLVLCFSRRLAKEMRKKIGKHPRVEVRTLHSFGLSVIRRWKGASKKGILTKEQERKLVNKVFDEVLARTIAKKTAPNAEDKKRLKGILMDVVLKGCNLEQALFAEKDLQKWKGGLDRAIKKINQHKEQANLMSFMEQITGALSLLLDPLLLASLGQEYDLLLVDELQDLSKEQYEIIRLLSSVIKRTVVVGDDAQAIYGFRGVVKNCFDTFAQSLKANKNNVKRFSLSQSFRCSKAVIKHGNAVRKGIRNVQDINLNSNQIGALPQWIECGDPNEMDRRVLEVIDTLKKKGIAYENIAILGRTHRSLALVNNALHRAGIPSVLGDRKLIATLCDAGKLMLQVVDGASSRYGELKELLGIEISHKDSKGSQQTLLKTNDQHLNKKINAAKKTEDWEHRLDLVCQVMEKHIQPLNKKTIPAHFDLLKHHAKHCKSKAEVYKMFDLYKRIPKDAVQLLTVHASKGLEFDAVIIVDLVDGYFPYQSRGQMLSQDTSRFNEERMLFYVASTRAKKFLFMLSRPFPLYKKERQKLQGGGDRCSLIGESIRRHLKTIHTKDHGIQVRVYKKTMA
jgi:DNA helicase-2/ATP-dependent DNA helicase PcrA